jgi:menaquinone-dependent protoporphyrinogen IX oxidase
MKGIIVFKGKYGATRQYAEWIKEELKYKIVDPKNCEKELQSSNLVILGSSVYIGKLQLKDWLNAYVELLKGKKLILFIVCGTPAHEKEKLESYVTASVPFEIRQRCQIYFLPGRLIQKSLSLKDKFMLWMGARLSRDPNVKKGMLTDYDAVKRENINDLIKNVREINERSALLKSIS